MLGREQLQDLLQLQVRDFVVDVLTGVHSKEAHLPQPLRISITVDLVPLERYGPGTPLSASKNYIDLKYAARAALPQGVHFILIEGVADHIAETLFTEDPRIRRVEVEIVKLAISEADEKIGITMVRHRR